MLSREDSCIVDASLVNRIKILYGFFGLLLDYYF